MKFEFLKYHNGSEFYPVKVEEINELEKKLNLTVPRELKDLLLEIGYGFIKGSENNVNRIMDTDSIRDFRLRKVSICDASSGVGLRKITDCPFFRITALE